MDPLDWALICELCGNARSSYQALARKFNLSSNTVKHRISKLREQEVITGFGTIVSMEMLGAEHVAGVISTDGTEQVVEFMKQVTKQQIVCEIYRTGDMRYEYWAMVSGASETLGFKKYLEGLDGVVEVEIRPVVFICPNKPPNYFLNTRGKKATFTKHQLRVLRCLYQDARMPISQIAKDTGFTPRRARKIIRELEESGSIHITTGYNIFAMGDMEYRLKIHYDESQKNGRDLIMDIYKKYSDWFWWSSVTTNEPIVDVGLIIDRPGRGVFIVQDLRESAFISSIEDYVSYPRIVANILPLRRKLEEMLIESGVLTESDIIRNQNTQLVSDVVDTRDQI
ncbi:MAG: winged helix-turn-helix transcriptional regulator [Candidatus Thorarchaeota archaeon]